jgi:hypothetical protein
LWAFHQNPGDAVDVVYLLLNYKVEMLTEKAQKGEQYHKHITDVESDKKTTSNFIFLRSQEESSA